jgi:hypothetical protein
MSEQLLMKKKKKEIPVVDANVVFLCHFDQTPPRNEANGQNGTVVNANYYQTQIILNDPASAKFGQGFLKAGGAVGGGASEMVTFPKGFTLGNRNFTIESWHKWASWSTGGGATQQGWTIGIQQGSVNSGIALMGTRFNGGQYIDINTTSNGPARRVDFPGLNSAESPVNDWFHVAVVREGAILRLYRNGKLKKAENIGTGNIFDGNMVHLGYSSNAYQAGTNMDEMRIVLDQVLYTSDFTPPKAPYPNPIIP